MFQTHTWLTHIWAFEYGPRTKMQVALVLNTQGRLEAAAPMMIEKRLGPLGVRVMRFIGRGFSDYQDIVLADDCDRDAAVTLLAGWLKDNKPGLDRVEFHKVPEGSHLWEHRERLLPTESSVWSLQTQPESPTRYLPIRGSFDDYQMILSKPVRKNFRKYWKSLNERYAVEFLTLSRAEGSDEALSDLIRLHQQRQNERGQRGMFRTPQRVELFTRLFKAMLDEGTLQLQVLRIDGRAYNIDLVFHYKGTALAYNGGMDNDPAIGRLSPGFLAMLKTIERAHADPGTTCFDLGQGDEGYKSHVAKHERPMYRLLSCRSNLRCCMDDKYHQLLAWAFNNRLVQRLYFGVRR
ncbi:MAG: GNAT family N-acetyltransferase [Phycisphaerales bacterium]